MTHLWHCWPPLLSGVTRCPGPLHSPHPTHTQDQPFSKKPYFFQWERYSKTVLRVRGMLSARGHCGEDLRGFFSSFWTTGVQLTFSALCLHLLPSIPALRGTQDVRIRRSTRLLIYFIPCNTHGLRIPISYVRVCINANTYAPMLVFYHHTDIRAKECWIFFFATCVSCFCSYFWMGHCVYMSIHIVIMHNIFSLLALI